jgi:hypothetical protein
LKKIKIAKKIGKKLEKKIGTKIGKKNARKIKEIFFISRPFASNIEFAYKRLKVKLIFHFFKLIKKLQAAARCENKALIL